MNKTKFVLEFSDKEMSDLLECVAKYHVVLYLQNKDNSHIEDLIKEIKHSLDAADKSKIFDKVYMEMQ